MRIMKELMIVNIYPNKKRYDEYFCFLMNLATPNGKRKLFVKVEEKFEKICNISTILKGAFFSNVENS